MIRLFALNLLLVSVDVSLVNDVGGMRLRVYLGFPLAKWLARKAGVVPQPPVRWRLDPLGNLEPTWRPPPAPSAGKEGGGRE